MCGISGFNWRDEGKIQKMVGSLDHRGPDARGVFLDEGVSLGHNRLSVIDLSSSANQPMLDNARELVIVFNGEIYNFRELREELQSFYEFKTKSDTEVLLAAYRKWGKKMPEKLNGMFAFAIWDKRSRELFCARDHAGIKPFYYYFDPSSTSGQAGKFIFGSEIKAILEHDVPRVISLEAFNHYLRVLYVPEPMTMFQNIFKLPPQSTLTLRGSSLSISKYGGFEMREAPETYEEATKMLKKKVVEAVERQMISDVPLGVYLSGGIDSSVVLASMSSLRKNIETFSIGFSLGEGEEAAKFNQDFELAQKTAAFFGAKHNGIRLSSRDALLALEEVAEASDDPVSNPTAPAMLLLSRFAKRKVTVVLTGSGGDELFGGYDRYRRALLSDYFMKFPRVLRALAALYPGVSKLENPDRGDLLERFMFEKDKRLSPVISSAFFKPGLFTKEYFSKKYLGNRGDSASSLMHFDKQSWLPDYFFSLSDKMSMRNALEERVPLTDRELVAFSAAIPRSFKLDLWHSKKILKDAFRADLPEFLFKEPKRGWFAPGAKWLRHPEFAAFVREVFSEGYCPEVAPLFDFTALGETLDKHISKERYNLTLIWAALTFQMWAHRYRPKL